MKPIVIRASGEPRILKDLYNEPIVMDIEDSINLGVCATTIQVFICGYFTF